MIYIFEGPDGGGKTTAAIDLRNAIQIPIAHFSYPKNGDRDMFAMYESVIECGHDVIMDRCWHSEAVYGPIMRGGSQLSEAQIEELDRMAEEVGCAVFYYSGDPDVLWERANSRGEEYVVSRETFDRICEAYESFYANSRLKVTRVVV